MHEDLMPEMGGVFAVGLHCENAGIYGEVLVFYVGICFTGVETSSPIIYLNQLVAIKT